MKKILHLLNSRIYSGAENVVITIINNMSKEYECLYVSPRGIIGEVCKINNVCYEEIEEMNVREIKRVINKFQPHIIHAHDFTASVKATLTLTKIPIISHLHNNPLWLKKIHPYSVIYGLTTMKYKKILGVSDSIINEYIFKKMLTRKWDTVSNPFDIEKVKRMSDKENDNEDIPEKVDILFLGRMEEEKNPIRFIEIIEEVKRQKLDIKVAMVGSGSLWEECRSQIHNKNLESNILQIQFLSNPYPIIKRAKMLIMTSKWEGYGLVALEAITLGVPVLAPPVGGLIEIIDEKCGLMCKSDKEYLCEIEMLLNEEGYREEKSKCAIVKAQEIANLNKYMRDLVSIYEEVSV